MLLIAILTILSNEGSLVGNERFARRHRQVLNEFLGTDFGQEPSVPDVNYVGRRVNT
jgi:hypothetical protein